MVKESGRRKSWKRNQGGFMKASRIQEAPRGTQKTPRRQPEGTQKAPRSHPGGTQEVPKDTQRHPGGAQEARGILEEKCANTY